MWCAAEFGGIKIVICCVEEVIDHLIIAMHSTPTDSRGTSQQRIINQTITLICTNTTISSCISIIKEVLDVVDVDIAQVVLALVELLLNLLVLLLFLLLGLQGFIDELERCDLIIDMQLPDEQAFLANLILFILLMIHNLIIDL